MTVASAHTGKETPPKRLGDMAIRYRVERERRNEIAPLSGESIHYILGGLVRSVGWDLPVSRLRRSHIEKWMARRDLAPTTRRQQLSAVRTFCHWLVVNGHVRRDPTLGIPIPRQPRVVPRALRATQIDSVLRHVPDARAALIISLEVQEGLRCCEVATIQLGDIDLTDGVMIVRKGKGGHQRVLPISDETRGQLEHYLSAFPATAGPLLRSYRQPTKGISAKYVSQLVARWMHSAGLAETGHALRHTMASDVLKGGAHLRDVQRALGHASLTTTQRYLPLVVNDLREAMGGRRYRGAAPS